MAKGGVRQGAGRKPRSEKYASEFQRVEAWVVNKLPDLYEKMWELAEGVKVKGANGQVYERAPDKDALMYLINRVQGKPTERLEVTEEVEFLVKMDV